MNEDYACPLCGRDDYRCKCELAYPAWPQPKPPPYPADDEDDDAAEA